MSTYEAKMNVYHTFIFQFFQSVKIPSHAQLHACNKNILLGHGG
jgi:hypothetical protein